MEIEYSSYSPEKIIKAEKIQLFLVALPLLIIVPEMIEEKISKIFIVLNMFFGLTYLTLIVNYKNILLLTEKKFENAINLFNGIVIMLTCSLPMFIAGKKYIPIIYLLIGLFHIFFFRKIQNKYSNKNKLVINADSFTLIRKLGKKNILFDEIDYIEAKLKIISLIPHKGKIIKIYVDLTENQLNELKNIIVKKIKWKINETN